MRRGRQGASLADRAAWSGVAPVSDRPPQPAAPPQPPRAPVDQARDGRRPADDGHGRHCWVRDPPDAPGIWPGLLVEWRQRDGAWQGRVAYTVSGPHGPALVETWLPAARLEPR